MIIHTKRNYVCAYKPLPQDAFVLVWVKGSDGLRLLKTTPIAYHARAVNLALEIADDMEHPVEVVPVSGVEYIRRNRAGIMRMSNQQNENVVSGIIASMMRILLTCKDANVCAGALDVLQKYEVTP